MCTRIVALLAACLVAVPALADPPAGYYSTATGTGAALKQQLHDIIDGHTVFSYGDARTILQDTDQDPADADRMLLVYNRVSLDVSSINPGGSIPGWDSGATWNREHTWPRSRGVNSSGADNSDLHQLRPSNPSVNSSRSNLNFGGAFGQSFGRVTDGGATVWYPGDADAGLIARQQFYMAVRYDGSDSNTTDLELAAGNTGAANSLGDLNRLLEWHYLAPPDFFETRRNDRVFSYQGNRNPFTDHPEWVHSVFIDNANDTQLSIAGAAVQADGSSTLAVDLGRVIVGAAHPTQTVTINKTGLDGTYFTASTSGAFLVDGDITASGAFAMGGPGTTDLEISLSSTSPIAGFAQQLLGSVTLDNLDVTTGGGTGVGNNDADDVINLSYTILDHSNPSLSSSVDLDAITLDFGTVSQGATGVQLPFEFGNFGSPGSLIADLDLDSGSAVGPLGPFSFDFSVLSGLAPGDFVPFNAFLDTSATGMFSGTFELFTSDEDIAGEGTDTLTINLLAEVIAASVAGDYDNSGSVGQPDLNLVLLNWGTTGVPAGWINDQPTGQIGQSELNEVLLNWGNTAEATTSSVPEPAMATVILLTALGLSRRECTCGQRSR